MHTPYDIVWGLSIACYARWAMFGWQLSVHGTGGVCAAALLAPAGELSVCLLCGDCMAPQLLHALSLAEGRINRLEQGRVAAMGSI